jgi:hypothetical protein
MDSVIREFIKNGKDVNELMAMPYSFVLDILAEQTKPKEEKSLIAAFGG